MKNESNQNTNISDEETLDEETRKRRRKARQQFRSPWFFIGLALLAFIIIFPRCTYRDNYKKHVERELHKIEMNQSSSQNGSVENFDSVPKIPKN